MDLNGDKELFIRLKLNDEQAFKILFLNYYSVLCNYAFQFLKDHDLAEEIVQNMFVKIWEKRHNLTIEISVKHYFFKSIRNQCLNHLQHEKIKKQYAGKVVELSHQEVVPEPFFMEVDLYKKIEKSIASLPPRRQEIFRLSREQGLKYQEIADSLKISVKTVEVQMGLALKHLREELKDFSEYLMTFFFIFKNFRSPNRG